jgi:cell division protein FtsQ
MPDTMPVLREPKQRRSGSRKLLTILLLLFAILLAVLFFRSPISKVSDVTISGGQYVTSESIHEAVGIRVGDSFFYPSEDALAKRIKKLAPIESAVVKKTFPGKIDIQVREYPAVAYELLDSGDITAILSNGTVLTAGSNYVVDKPVLSGWTKDDPFKAELIQALSNIPDDLRSDFSEIMPYPSNSYKDRIRIYTRTKFEIITAVSLLQEKAETIYAVIETQEPGSITMLLSDRYVPYLDEDGTEGHTNAEGE